MKSLLMKPEPLIRAAIKIALWTLVFTALYMIVKGHHINDFPL